MVAVTLVVVCLASFVVGWLIADSIMERRYDKRQDFMEKINRMFP